jgi:cytidylate kinase
VIIAIDGPAASGKGTLAQRIARHYGLAYLDTGLLYRAVARDVLRQKGALNDGALAAAVARALDPATLEDPELRTRAIGEAASIVASIPEVRAALLQFQRDFARRPPGTVLDGRDIGTVVCPDADVKIFVTASPEVRAKRRHLELKARGETIGYDEILENIRLRDERDASRQAAPLRPAEDAFLLDTSTLDIEAAFETAIGVIDRKLGRRECT